MEELQTGISSLEKTLKAGKRQLTVGDAASISAVNVDDAKRALEALLAKYESRLQVTENGDLIYDFGATLKRRNQKSFKEVWAEIRQKAWMIFKFLFRIWITLMLVVYFVLFVVVLIGLVFASMSGDDDDDGGSPLGYFQMYIIIDLFTDLLLYRTVTRNTVYHTDEYGYTYKAYEPVGRVRRGKRKKSFVASVYDFVFGPPRYIADKLANFKEVAAFLRQQKAIMVQSDVVGLAGLRRDDAENFFTECLVKFNGEAEITDKGTLVGTFDELVRGKVELNPAKVQWYWEEYEAPYEQSGNSNFRNFLIGGMNGVNLVFSVLMMQGLLYKVMPGLSTQTLETGTVLLGIIPFVFSLIFFLIPIVRYFDIRKKNGQIHKENIRKRLMKAVFNAKDGQVSEEMLLELVNQNGREEALDNSKIQAIMHDLVLDLGGNLSVTETGKLIYHFDNLKREMEDAAQRRAQRKDNNGLGDVIFDTDQA